MVAAVDVVTAGVLERMAKPTERVVHQAGRDFNTEEAVRFIYFFVYTFNLLSVYRFFFFTLSFSFFFNFQHLCRFSQLYAITMIQINCKNQSSKA